ncbi:MAG: helix-turn-helix domain-containing protein [Acidipropionibacterium acidipropionici]|jgi:DNA-binding XRE family transcriptional regulator|nr:helix-turn-helix domain-containing protein [Acidipropionibacterium acidipropionici]
MKVSELTSFDQMEHERYESDPAYAAEADRLALADAVSVAVLVYRTDHGLTQTAFGRRLGMKQPQVARLERGDTPPSVETLQRLASAGVLEVTIAASGTTVRELATA